jgi:hypothetical protein
MLASSGLDGAYLAALIGPLGYLLNTTVDVATEVVIHQATQLRRQNRKGSKLHRMSWLLYGGNAILVAYSAYLSTMYLLTLGLPLVHAAITSCLVPVAIALTGLAQALADEPPERSERPAAVSERSPAKSEQPPAASGRMSIDQWRSLLAEWASDERPASGPAVNDRLQALGYEKLPASTARRWAREETE